MSFSIDWLALREPFDRAAREASVLDLQPLREAARAANEAAMTPYRVLDLGCGTGANLRSLAPRLSGAQRWQLVDHDARLLAALPRVMSEWAQAQRLKMPPPSSPGGDSLRIEGPEWSVELSWQKADLVHELDTLPFEGCHLVTASALLDLVSASWLAALLTQVHEARTAVLFALTVDGRIDWQPTLASDAQVTQLFAAHQQHRDKGFGGPALGANAVPRAIERLVALGYSCVQAGSDWELGPASGARLLTQMIDGLAVAAMEQDPDARDLVLAWRLRRLAMAAHSHLRVGHAELLALPAAT